MNAKIPEGVNKNPMEGKVYTGESVLILRNRLRKETKKLLEAKTSEELIAGYEKIMSIINAQIEVNNTELEEIKAQLLSVKKENQTNYEKLQRRKEELEDLGERLERKNEEIEYKIKEVKQFGIPSKETVRFRSLSKRLNASDVFYDKKCNICVVLYDYTDYPKYINGFGACEYGTKIRIIRGDNKTEQGFIWRFGYDRANDDSKYYEKIENVNIDGDRVEVTVSSTQSKDTYVYNVPYKEPKKTEKSKNTKKVETFVDKEAFKIIVKQKENELITWYTKKDFIQPVIDDKENELLVNNTLGSGLYNVPYDEPKVLSEKINLRFGKACIVIKVHNDHAPDGGKQFYLVKCVINSKGETIGRSVYDYWQSELKEKPGIKSELERFINTW